VSSPNVPHAIEPGARLVDRYRLEQHLGHADDTAYWRATDELLDRPVGLCLLQDGSTHGQRVLAAARKAAAVTDPRFLRVLDANEDGGVVYVVSEWVSATNLADLLAEAPLSPGQARDLAAEVAGALDAAHRDGLAHLCLTPEHVLRTGHGQIKVAGLAVDAAVRGLRASDPADAAARDAAGAVAVLYAALTARWPGENVSQVTPAPYDGDRLCSPRQVRAGVPDELDSLVAASLDAGPRHGSDPGEPVRTPAELARRLAAHAPTSRIPVVGRAGEGRRDDADDTASSYATGPYVARYDDEGARRGRLAGRAAYVLAGLALLVGLGLVAWQLVSFDLGGSSPGPETSRSSDPGPQTEKLPITSGTSLDPPPAGNGDENSDRAAQAFDGDDATVWNTNIYRQQLGPGGLKEGVGLLLDLGSQHAVSSVTVTLVGDATDLQVRLADEQGGQLDDYRPVGDASEASGRAVVRLSKPADARYVLIWLTKLPQVPGGFRGQIAEAVVRG
jgi:hypothetical protein